MTVAIPPHAHEYLLSERGHPLREDLKVWAMWRNFEITSEESLRQVFDAHFFKYAEFRSLVDYRQKQSKDYEKYKILPAIARCNDLYLYCDDIGTGLRIQHGHSTWVLAEKVGRNFLVNQNVTIGVDKGGKPTIGDNVQVRTGAVVTGAIKIGNNVTIAPNAFVNFDVPNDTTVFPARSVMVTRKSAAMS